LHAHTHTHTHKWRSWTQGACGRIMWMFLLPPPLSPKHSCLHACAHIHSWELQKTVPLAMVTLGMEIWRICWANSRQARNSIEVLKLRVAEGQDRSSRHLWLIETMNACRKDIRRSGEVKAKADLNTTWILSVSQITHHPSAKRKDLWAWDS
jgi:hypothetical protein